MPETEAPKITARQLHETHRWIQLDELALLPKNPNEGHKDSLEASLDEFGWIDGIVVHDGIVIAGNHRVKAAQETGEEGLPGYDLSGIPLDDARRMAIALAHNRTTRAGQNNPQLLAEAMYGLGEAAPSLALATGLSTLAETDPLAAEILGLTNGNEPPEPTEDGLDLLDVTIDEPKTETHLGQVWRLARHTLVINSVLHGWPVWAPLLEAGCAFIPYPSPLYPTIVEIPDEETLVMVQPDLYLAGHILDIWEALNGPAELVE